MATRPTKKQRELLNFIEGFISGHGYGPSYREIMRGMGYKSVSTVATHIDNLIARGHLRKRTNSARSLEVVDEEDFESDNDVKIQQEKWLVGEINTRFRVLESAKKPDQAQLDELYVLIGALKVLGFDEPARAFTGRLNQFR